jgi:Domain of unknown function (DUF2017)
VRRSEPFRRDDDGFAVNLPGPARDLLGSIAEQMHEVLTGATADDDPAVARLFPQAYPDDPMRTIEFERVAADDLQRDRVARFHVLAETVRARWLTEEQLLEWMRAINDARIVLGVRLDVTEDMTPDDVEDDPERADTFRTYVYLSALLEAIVQALGDPLR